MVRIFMHLIAVLSLQSRLYDIGNAFLEGPLNEELYMKLPDYVLDGAYVRLRKAIYGLKQAGKIFVDLLAKFLLELGFERSKTEPFACVDMPSLYGRFRLPTAWPCAHW